MNKQELIDKLASLVGSIEDFKGISTFHDGKYAGLEHALELIKQLEEPQKSVVPKFVADWFEDNKHALDLAIFTKIRELDGKRYPHETDFENWLDNAENNPIETLIRMKDGPRGAIFEADGGAWRNQAIVNIREYLYERLEEEIKSKRVTILA